MIKYILFALISISIFTVPLTARVAPYQGENVNVTGYGIGSWQIENIKSEKKSIKKDCAAACRTLNPATPDYLDHEQKSAGIYRCMCYKK